MAPAENKALIRRYYDEIWKKRNLSIVDEIIGPEISFRGSLASLCRAVIGVRRS